MSSDSPRRMLQQHGLRPKHAWGQNFLDDERVLADIVQAARLGPGSVVVERDRDMLQVLEETRDQRLTVVAANAAELELAAVAGTRPLTLVGNLPYHLTSSILFEVLDQHTDLLRCVFTVQKEVAERVAAGEGARSGGILTVLLGVWFDASIVRSVPASAFHPPPKVDSAVLLLEHRSTPRAEVGDGRWFRKVVKAAFSHRRKTLLNSLRSDPELGEAAHLREALGAAGVDPSRRAETLGIGEFARLAGALRQSDRHG